MTSDGSSEAEKAAALFASSLCVLGVILPDLPDLPSLPLIDRKAQDAAKREAQRLAREAEGMQSQIARYMDSRDAAGGDAANERILPEDPWKTGPLAQFKLETPKKDVSLAGASEDADPPSIIATMAANDRAVDAEADPNAGASERKE